MGNGEADDTPAAPTGCCLVGLFRHPRRSRSSVTTSDVRLGEPAKLAVPSTSSGSTNGENDKAKLIVPYNSSGDKAVAAAVSSVSMANTQCESDKGSLLVPAASEHNKSQERGPPLPNKGSTHKDHMTRKRSKRRNLVRASSSNVMIFANLGNLGRGKKSSCAAAMSPGRDVLEYLPKTAKELQADAGKGNSKSSKDVAEVAVAAAAAVKDRFEGLDGEGLKEMGNEEYKKGNYAMALSLYDEAIKKDPHKAAYWSNKAAALIGLGRLLEAVWECREAVRIDPSYCRAHYRLAVLYTRLGDVEKAINHYTLAQNEASSEDLSRAQALQTHLANCEEARTCKDWHALLKQTQIVVSIGADSAPQVFASQAEALLNLHRHEEAEVAIASAPKFDTDVSTNYFGAADTAHFLAVQAHVDLAAGRFENAVAAAEKASQLNPGDGDYSSLTAKALAMSSARSRGNDLFKASKFEEACSAYGEGLARDPYNAILLCNRAACLLKLGEWEKVIEACSTALEIRPSYNKARLRRADCNAKLHCWAAAIEDYEFLLREMPGEEELVKALFEAHVQLEKQQEGDHGAVFDLIETKDQFWEIVKSPGLSVALFFRKSSEASKNLVPSAEQLSKQFPSVNFFQVDVEGSSDLATSENITSEPVFKFYKNGLNVESIIGSDLETLESSIRSFST